MAVNPRDIRLDRSVVAGWLNVWSGLDPQPDIREFLIGQLKGWALEDTMVNTEAHESQENETPLLEMIMQDLPSYGITDF